MEQIVAQLKKPLVAAIVAGIAGLVFGLIYAWNIDPVVYENAPPELLSHEAKVEYLRMAIDSYRIQNNPDLALQRWLALGGGAEAALAEIEAERGSQDPTAIGVFRQIADSVQTDNEVDLNAISGEPQKNNGMLIVVFSVLSLAALAVAGFLFLRRFGFFRSPGARVITPQKQAQEYARSTERTDFQSMGLAQPVTQTMTTYVLGDDLYDESFSIDSPAGEFMGEYGVGVSETIGVGDPKKVTAFEVWLFDKNDIKTATKVLMSPHAYQDPAIRQRLEAKGELVQIDPNKQILLETATLQLLATVADVEYGSSALPADSFFERLTLELAVWPKEGEQPSVQAF
ncbi:MAG: hypothetical protein JXA13_10960 [Anaerolineales bacterium]|nr:hypothetical protein [Anaerolineales bacterium]